MSNPTNDNPNLGNNGQDPKNPEPPKTEKKGFIAWITDGYNNFKSTKVGRWVVRGGKVVAGVGALYGAFKAGQHSMMAPDTVCIEGGDVQEEEDQVEETEEENQE